jgi:hypothetical protein
MKKLLGVAALFLFFSLPAHAQGSLGGALNSGAGHILQAYPALSNSITYATGPADFVPSTFMSYDQAVAAGRAAIAEHTKSLGEVAKESRDREKNKAKMVIEQDSDNRVVPVTPR